MDVSRLLAVLQDVATDYNNGIRDKMSALVATYTSARDNPTQDLSAQLNQAVANLRQEFQQSFVETYPPSRVKIVQRLGGIDLTGLSAMAKIEDVLVPAPGATLAGAVTRLGDIANQLSEFYTTCETVASGLVKLGVAPQVLGSDEHEIGVMIPDGMTDSQLAGFLKELRNWNIALRGIAAAAREQHPEVLVRDFSSGSLEVYFAVGLVTAKITSEIIDKVLTWYTRILEVQKARKELVRLDALPEDAKAVENFEKKYLTEQIGELVSGLMKEASKSLPSDDHARTEQQLTVAVKYVARFVDHGGSVEVTAGIPELPDEPEPLGADATKEQRKAFAEARKEYERLGRAQDIALEISTRGRAIHLLPRRDKPILQLPKSSGELGEDEGKEGGGKKG